MCKCHKAPNGWFRIKKFFPARQGRSDEVEAHEPCYVWIPAADNGITCEACGHVVIGLRCDECCWLSTAGYWMSPPRCSNPDRPKWRNKHGKGTACPEFAEATPCEKCGGDMRIGSACDTPDGQVRLWYCRPCAESRATVHGDW